MADWVETNWANVLMVIISALVVYAALITLTRISGVRSFSKMSGFDFAITVATGSVAATIIVAKDPPLLQGLVALAMLYVMQMAVAALRKRSRAIEHLVDNEPRLIMVGDTFQEDQMKKAKITRDDLYAKLRDANVTDMAQVYAVVAETTGEISVLHGPPGQRLDPEMLRNVIAGDRFKQPSQG